MRSIVDGVDQAGIELGDARDDVPRAAFGLGGDALAFDFIALVVECDTLDLGAAQVDSDPEHAFVPMRLCGHGMCAVIFAGQCRL